VHLFIAAYSNLKTSAFELSFSFALYHKLGGIGNCFIVAIRSLLYQIPHIKKLES